MSGANGSKPPGAGRPWPAIRLERRQGARGPFLGATVAADMLLPAGCEVTLRRDGDTYVLVASPGRSLTKAAQSAAWRANLTGSAHRVDARDAGGEVAPWTDGHVLREGELS